MSELAELQSGGRKVQRRGEERRKAILDAAEQLLVEVGYDATTLKAVGDRAGIPTASMYHYFADRHEVETELLARHLDALAEHMERTVSLPTKPTLDDVIDAVIAPMVDYFRRNRGVVELWFGHRQPHIAEMVQAFDHAQAEEFWGLVRREKLVRRTTPLLVIELAFEAGNRMFDLAFRASVTGDDTILTEARRMISAYLSTYAPTGRRS